MRVLSVITILIVILCSDTHPPILDILHSFTCTLFRKQYVFLHKHNALNALCARAVASSFVFRLGIATPIVNDSYSLLCAQCGWAQWDRCSHSVFIGRAQVQIHMSIMRTALIRLIAILHAAYGSHWRNYLFAFALIHSLFEFGSNVCREFKTICLCAMCMYIEWQFVRNV